jgi:hypothetical protein
VFEEGFEKINRLNNEIKDWGPRISELEFEIRTTEKIINKESNNEYFKDLFHSRQIITIPEEKRKIGGGKDLKNEEILRGNEKEENIEKKKNMEKKENGYEEFLITLLQFFV